MKSNYLKKHIEAFFTEATALNGNLNIIDIFLKARSEQLKTNFPFPDYNLYSMMTNYRDLSQLEGGPNLYDTGNRYYLTTNNLEDETARLLSYMSCLTVTQIFEVFESFLKNILTESILQNIKLIDLLKIEPLDDQFYSIRNAICKLQGTNNKGIIKAIRKVSPFFKQHEHNNIWKRNMSNWFDLIATIRHIVIHQRQIVKGDFIEFVNKRGFEQLFEMHFTIKDSLLILTPYEANAVIGHLYEYAHLIYKGLSNDFRLNLDFNFKPLKFN